MEKYQIPLPLPGQGLNLIDDSLIADNEAAEGTKNISFKDGVPQTRKGSAKASPFNFTPDANTLIVFTKNSVPAVYAAAGTKLKRQNGNSFDDLTGAIASDKVSHLSYACSIGYAHTPDNVALSDAGAGSLAAGTYYYRVTATTPHGETEPSTEVSLQVSASKAIKIMWNRVQSAAGYKVYGRAQGAELLLATIGSGSTLTWTDNGTGTPSGAMPTTNTTATTFGDKLFILDGTTYQYLDGNTLEAVHPHSPSTYEVNAYGENVLISVPDEINKQRFILNDDERTWVAGYGKLVRMSYLQQPDYFPSTHAWKLEEDCTGMARFMGEVILFTQNTATLISGKTPDWTLPERYIYTKLPGGYGCNAHRSIAVGNNALYWANKDGVYRYRYLPSGYSIPECISEFQVAVGNRTHTRSIKKALAAITDWTKVFANFYDNEYRLYIGGGKVLVFDSVGSTWALYEYDTDFNCGMVYDSKLYYAKSYMRLIDKEYNPDGETFEGLSDDGAAIEFRLKSKAYDFGKAANKKKFKELYISLFSELVSYNIDLILNLDNEYFSITGEIQNKVSRMGQLAFGDRIATKKTNLNYPVRVHHKGKRYNLQYEMVCTGLNMAFLVKSIELLFKVKELK